MAAGYWNPALTLDARRQQVREVMAAQAAQNPAVNLQANTAAALAPTAAASPLAGSSPLGSSFGLGLGPGYASALTRYLDPQAMESQIFSDAQKAAGNAAADRGFGLGDNIGARLTGEIAAPALQAYRMNLLNQIPQFWQMEHEQQMAADARADRQRELAWQREQRQWDLKDRDWERRNAEEDRAYQERLREEELRNYRNSTAAGSAAGGRFDSTYGLFAGLGSNPGGGSATGSVIGSPNPGSSSGFGLPGSQTGLWRDANGNIGGKSGGGSSQTPMYETRQDAINRGAALQGMPSTSGMSLLNTANSTFSSFNQGVTNAQNAVRANQLGGTTASFMTKDNNWWKS